MKGLIHIYTGNGKGKTTAAIGLGIRAYGRGMKVLMVQFMKGMETGEMFTMEKLGPGFTLYRGHEVSKFTWNMNSEELDAMKQNLEKDLEYAISEASTGNWDMLILDEVVGAVSSGYLSLDKLAGFIRNKPDALEIVMTGRNAPQELVETAHYVSEIKAVKHPYEQGISARIGIER